MGEIDEQEGGSVWGFDLLLNREIRSKSRKERWKCERGGMERGKRGNAGLGFETYHSACRSWHKSRAERSVMCTVPARPDCSIRAACEVGGEVVSSE